MGICSCMIGWPVTGSVETGPMALGVTGFGLLALLVVLFAEKGRLFKSHHLPPVKHA